MDFSYLPIIFNLENESDADAFNSLIKDKSINIIDEILSQLKEYVKCSNPSKRYTDELYNEHIKRHLNGRSLYKYGVWVYYPWNKHIIHLLYQEEFITVRTNRNQYKITKQEQEILNKKTIGIAGLSVGHSVALTIATERICGELRLADFDILELSNCNRIRTSLKNIGLKKVIIAAREIAEIDPFIKVVIYEQGLTSENMDDFFTKETKLDVFVEVCDSIEIKLLSRYKAKDMKVCVVMDTNDKGMLDIERFDLEIDREILHGLIGNLAISTNTMTLDEKTELIYKILDINNISKELKFSMSEIGKSINTWPQLASSTTLGGAMTTDICRKILLNKHTKSGRFYVDFDELIPT